MIARMLRSVTLGAVVTLATSTGTLAQAPPEINQPAVPASAPITLSDALAYARQNYPAVRAALADKQAADRDVDMARTAYLPQINLLAQINRSTVNNVTGLLLPQPGLPAISGPVLPETGQSAWNSAVGVSASWRPFDFGYRSAKVEAARSAADAADESVNLTRLEVELATTNAFLNLLAAQKLQQVAHANLTRLASFSTAVQVLVTNKLRAGAEGEQANAAAALARASVISAEANVATQRAILAKLVGRPIGSAAIDAASLDHPAPVMAGTAGQADSHPAVRLEAARTNQQVAALNATRRSVAPQVDVVGGAFARGSGKTSTGRYLDGTSGLNPDVTNWAAGLQLSFPLGNLPAVHAQASAQRARVEAQRARYDQARADAEERLERARVDLSAAQQIETVTPAALQSARTTEQQQRIRYQTGLATVVDVTSAEATLAQAETQDAIARLNSWRALATLAAAQGDLAPFEQLLRP